MDNLIIKNCPKCGKSMVFLAGQGLSLVICPACNTKSIYSEGNLYLLAQSNQINNTSETKNVLPSKPTPTKSKDINGLEDKTLVDRNQTRVSNTVLGFDINQRSYSQGDGNNTDINDLIRKNAVIKENKKRKSQNGTVQRKKNKMGTFITVFLILFSLSVIVGVILYSSNPFHTHTWVEASCDKPRTCSVCGKQEGVILGHSWIEATCNEPKTCQRCGETQGYALGHNWKNATCTTPKTCSRCGDTEGIAKGHLWSIATESVPSTCSRCGETKPMTLPRSGTVFIGNNVYTESELTISTDDNCYVKLKNSSGDCVYSFFVRANERNFTMDVPSGYFYVYFACGDEWYGTEQHFGNGTTSYSKDDELLDFFDYTYSYTLYKVSNGNFQETPISKDEFD